MKGSLPKMAMMIMLIIAVSVVVTTVVSIIVFSLAANQNQQPAVTQNPSYDSNAVLLKHSVGVFTTDLSDKRFVQLEIVLRYPEIKRKTWFGLMEEVDNTIIDALVDKESEIKDAITTVLRNKTSNDLRGESLEKTKSELVSRINGLLPNMAQIYDALFVDIKVQ